MFAKKLFLNPWRSIRSANNRSAHSGEKFNVAIVGAAGGIGQPLSMLIRVNPLVSRLSLFDLKLAVGVAADVSHIDVQGTVQGFEGKEKMKDALACADLVIIPAGMPRKPGQTRDDLFKVNADVVANVMDTVAVACPKAFLAIITNPVNSTVPVAREVLKKRNVYDPARLFGVTTLDTVRARKFIGDKLQADPRRVKIKVVGGHSASTIIPVISDCEPQFKFDDDEVAKITNRIKNGGTEVVEAKAGAGSATLSMAYAGALFAGSLLKALSGENVADVAYVESCLTEAEFFASPIIIGKSGISDFPALPEFDSFEKSLLCKAMPELLKDIKQGVDHGKAFGSDKSKSECTPKKK